MKKLMFLMSFVSVFGVKMLNSASESKMGQVRSYLGLQNQDPSKSDVDKGILLANIVSTLKADDIKRHKAALVKAQVELKNASSAEGRALAQEKVNSLQKAIDTLVKMQANDLEQQRAKLEGRAFYAPYPEVLDEQYASEDASNWSRLRADW